MFERETKGLLVSTSMLVYLRVTDQTSGIFMGFDMIESTITGKSVVYAYQ